MKPGAGPGRAVGGPGYPGSVPPTRRVSVLAALLLSASCLGGLQAATRDASGGTRTGDVVGPDSFHAPILRAAKVDSRVEWADPPLPVAVLGNWVLALVLVTWAMAWTRPVGSGSGGRPLPVRLRAPPRSLVG